MSISVKNLTKVYGEQTAVNNISFEISQGTIVGFLGPNGAGKSTTMKMITSYVEPTSGTISVCGFDAVNQSVETRRRIGYMPENNPLYYDMYVREFLDFAAGIHQLGSKSKLRIDEMIALTGLTKEVRKKIGALSRGYKQRVGLAQAMLHDPEVLILDEPTSGLDPNQIVDIRNLITQIGMEKTVMLSTHIMQEVQAICNRIIIVNNGNIVADDRIENITVTGDQKITVLRIQLDQPVAADSWKVLKSVQQAHLAVETEWLLETAAPDQLRKELMVWAVQQDIVILSMQEVSESLEEIFRKLTK